MTLRHAVSALALGFAILPGAVAVEVPPLLQAAVDNWVAGKQDVAFTQRTRILNDTGGVKEERLERYDPSLPDDKRWHLLEVDGKPPTAGQRVAIQDQRNRKPRKKATRAPGEILDFQRATVSTENARTVTYEVAVRPEAARLVQTENILLLITVGRESQAVEGVTARLRDTVRVALGLARINDVDLDLSFDPPDDPGSAKNKQTHDEAEPNGTARASITKLGRQMELEWWDFKRVETYRGQRVSATERAK